MSDGFFEFFDDDSSAGFRLKQVELYNWGTFHNKVVTFPLEGRNGLLTGDIGSGKSTVVDAVTTLLVPAHRVSYNKAAGADFKERSLRSYVLGYFKSERSDGGFSAKPVPLRKEGTSHSVIAGVFYNEGYSQTVTLAQVFFQKESTGQPDRFYVVSQRELSIGQDFSDFGKELSPLKKRLKADEKNEVFDSFPPYGAAFRRYFGLQGEQALELFHQTVSLKTVGNLTSFVQEHMLEPFDAEKHLDNLIRHFDDLNKAHESILRAKKQIEQLTPLVENLDRYRDTASDAEEKIQWRNSLKYYFASLKADFLEEKIKREKELHGKITLKIQAAGAALTQLRGDRDEIRESIAANGGDRLENLKRNLHQLEEDKRNRLRRAEEYNDLARFLELPLFDDPGVFADNRNRISGKISEAESKRNQVRNDLTDLEVEFRALRENQKKLESEILSLKMRKSNIDSRQINLRSRLCSDLDLGEEELPFAGELLMVRESEKEWEGALERVLRNFSLSLLVPDRLYTKVAAWVDKTDLRGRLVYYRVGEYRRSPVWEADPSLLTEKVDVKNDSPFRGWLKDQLSRRFDYKCCANLDEFRLTGKGLTRAGQIKGSSARHEKDDSYAIGDRRRYVLGWSNLSKIAALSEEKEKTEKMIADRSGGITGFQKQISELEDRLYKLKELGHYRDFEELHWQPLALKIEDVNTEIHQLESHSDILRSLQEKLKEIEGRIQETDRIEREQSANRAKIEQKLEDFQAKFIEEEALFKEAERSPDELKALLHAGVTGHLGDKKLNYMNCDSSERQFREKLQREIDAANKRMDYLSQKIVKTMEQFRLEYPSETREMDATLQSEGEFRQFLEKLIKDNLPQFEAQFRELLNQNTIREIASFHTQLKIACEKIRDRVDKINRSMAEIEYNKDRYIYLEAMNTNDVEVRNFRQELKNCTEGSFTMDGGDQYTESKFLQVKELIDRFKGREGRSDSDIKWTRKVTDVRNWFAFAASERWKEDGSEYEHYTDSGGKSGGQKEKLAYTVLAASLAYQFGLEWGEVRSRSFRFVVIDEAFGRGSDESAKYGLELFRKLNLQLLIVTPLQKIHIIEPFVSTVGFVHNPEGRKSYLRCLTISQYRKEKERRDV